MNFRKIVSALGLALSLLVSPLLAAEGPDIRVLIDVSGSMKKNDPEMLRADGLRLLLGLLPANARAGVWSFGRYVTLDTPVGQVDARWKARAAAGAAKIHSRSQNTDIEEGLKRASKDWQVATEADRHIILMTDGVVDVGKDEARNAASRQRILDELIPRLQTLGARVHTVALSEESDQDLMRSLSMETDGWYESVADAQTLQRVFLRMFEKAAPPDTVPLVDNLFQVDDSIEELTLLVFREGSAPPTEIRQPDGVQFVHATVPANARWVQGEGYDLVTVSEPLVGEWQVIADLDPDNRVMVVTDLQFKAEPLANNLAPKAHPKLAARLLQEGKVLTDPDFLSVVQVELEHQMPGGQKIKRPLNFNNGVYEATVLDVLSDGEHVFLWRADSGTFQRTIRQTAGVRVPVDVEVVPLAAERGDHMFRVAARVDMIDPDSLQVTASVRDPSGRMISLDPQPEDKAHWTGHLLGLTDAGTYNLFITVNANTLEAKGIELVMQPIAVKGTGTTAGPDPTALDPGATDGVDWLAVGGWVAAFNLTIAGLGGGAYWYIRRRRGRSEFELVEEET